MLVWWKRHFRLRSYLMRMRTRGAYLQDPSEHLHFCCLQALASRYVKVLHGLLFEAPFYKNADGEICICLVGELQDSLAKCCRDHCTEFSFIFAKSKRAPRTTLFKEISWHDIHVWCPMARFFRTIMVVYVCNQIWLVWLSPLYTKGYYCHVN